MSLALAVSLRLELDHVDGLLLVASATCRSLGFATWWRLTSHRVIVLGVAVAVATAVVEVVHIVVVVVVVVVIVEVRHWYRGTWTVA